MNSLEISGALGAIIAVQLVTSAAMLGLGQRESAVRRWLPYLVSGAAGVLLATACLDLLPEAVRDAGADLRMWDVLLCTLLSLFCLQAFAHWLSDDAAHDPHGFTTHGDHAETANGEKARAQESPRRRTGPGTLLLGSALHSTVDGVAIAAAFAAGPKAGWSATLAVGLHELPHRLGDFALLLHMGVPRNRAAAAAIAAGTMALAGAVGVVLFGHTAASAAWLLPVSAGSFLYIALVDLLPEMHATRQGSHVWLQLICLGAGAALMAAVLHAAGD